MTSKPDTDTRRILTISGSLRRASLNQHLLLACADLAPHGMSMQSWTGLSDIPPFDEDLETIGDGGVPEAVYRLRAAVANADGLLIATPEYNQSLPGVLKNVIDWLSRPAPEEVLIGKPVAILGASAGRWGTRLAQAALRQTLTATESVVMPSPMLFLADAARLFDDDGRLHDAHTRNALTSLLRAFDRWIESTARESAETCEAVTA